MRGDVPWATLQLCSHTWIGTSTRLSQVVLHRGLLAPHLLQQGPKKVLSGAEGGKRRAVSSQGSLGRGAVATSKPLKVGAAVCCF